MRTCGTKGAGRSAETPERKARLLAAPSLILGAAAFIIIPWLLQTGKRLQNDYWERQILFALTTLYIASCGIPFVFLRMFRRVRILSMLGWSITVLGYVSLIAYMLQSHFLLLLKLIYTLMGLVCLRWAVQGLRLDAQMPQEES